MRIRVEMRKNREIRLTIMTRERRINRSSRETNHCRLGEIPPAEILKLRCMEALYKLMVLSWTVPVFSQYWRRCNKYESPYIH